MAAPIDVGIDLGTTFSVLAVAGRVKLRAEYGDGTYLEQCDVTIIPTPYGEPTFPSVIVKAPDEACVFRFGTDALESVEEGLDPVLFAKRKIGTREAIAVTDGTMTAREVAAEFLHHLKTCAEAALGRPVKRAVVTHPAYFSRAAVEETRAAAVAAGFQMDIADQMVMEPVAAALAYTRSNPRDPLCVLTYDLGGGTFDVTCLERTGGVVAMRAFDGDPLLGGYNFDRALARWILQRIADRGRVVTLDADRVEDRPRIVRLLQLAERVKRALAGVSDDDTAVPIRGRSVLRDVTGKEVPIDERITRRDFVGLIRPWLEKTVDCTRAALAKADMSAADVDEVLLVGGSVRGPWISDVLAEAFPGIPCRTFEPDLCVAVGAAIHARMVLPPLVEGAASGWTLMLDTPETSPLESVRVQGVVQGTGSGEDGVAARLESLASGHVRTEPVARDGSFAFERVDLEEDGENRLVITITEVGGKARVEHAFTIVYDPAGAESTLVTSVLPRTLAVETVDGIVPIAESGAVLPVRCQRSFVRQNSNPNVTLRLLQDHSVVGEIRLEDIPPEGGIGSLVELNVEITSESAIRGSAVIRSRDGRVTHHCNVDVVIEPADVPGRDELVERLTELQAEWRRLAASDDRRAVELEPIVSARIAEIEDRFREVPLERQEIQAGVKRLERILAPVADDMRPTFVEFAESVIVCRQETGRLLRAAEETEIDDQASARTATSRRRRAELLREQSRQIELALDELEARAEQVHAQSDRRSWARVNESLATLRARARAPLQEREEAPPVLLSRTLFVMEISKLLRVLEDAAQGLKKQGHAEDWQPEIRRILIGLHRVRESADAIGDNVPADIALARLRKLEMNVVRPLRDAIDNLGIDIARCHQGAGDTSGELDSLHGATDIHDDEALTAEAARALLGAGLTSIFSAVAADAGALDQQDRQGHTPLMLATYGADADLMKDLIAKGADVGARDNLGRTALFLAPDAATADILLEAGAVLEVRDEQDVTPLIYAAHEGRAEVVARLLDHGAEIEARWQTGGTALGVAAAAGHLSTMQLLLDRGAAIAARDGDGRAPLHHAAVGDSPAVVGLLLDRGAEVDIRDERGETPLFLAAFFGKEASVDVLLSQGADPTLTQSTAGANAVMAAAFRQHPTVLRQLLDVTDVLEFTDKDGDTVLFHAAEGGSVECLRLVIGHGARLDARNNRRFTPLMMAAQHGHLDAVRYLLERGVDPAATDTEGRTAREVAMASGHPEIAEFLSQAGETA